MSRSYSWEERVSADERALEETLEELKRDPALNERWYFSHRTQRFERNRRRTKLRDRRRPTRPPVYGPGLDAIIPLPSERP